MEKHVPVLLSETIELLKINPDGVYLDMTLGGGGHSQAILDKLTEGKLYGFDQDPYAIKYSIARFKEYPSFYPIEANFKDMIMELNKRSIKEVDGILFDLGVSSFQFDQAQRGFSYRFDAPLDMRMNPNNKLSAYNVINDYDYEDLVKIFFEYGEEKYARSIAKRIVQKRETDEIFTTFQLVEAIKEALPNKELNKKGHPAKKVFQAIRIEVNQELTILEQALINAIDVLKKKGRLGVITFHSLEDRICKHLFRRLSTIDIPKGLPIINKEEPIISIVTKKAVIASQNEIEENFRAHSAKLRVIEKN
jgi:16S rRNA (cytosine1402-N4)-methyltransferase